MLCVGIDPGTSVSSPTGLVVFNPETLVIHSFHTVKSDLPTGEGRLREIVSEIKNLLYKLELKYPKEEVIVGVETFVMQGKGGQTLHQFIGAVISVIPTRFKIKHVFNTTIKKLVAKNGHADKMSVAGGVLDFFHKNERSAALINTLIDEENWDVTDAFAIGVSAFLLRSSIEGF